MRVEEEETPEHNTLREEDTLTTEEEQYQSPSNKRKSSSSLLENLLGQTFTDARVQQQPMSAYARAEEEVTKYRSAPSLPLSEDPLSWWSKNQMMFPLISKLAKRYLCIPGTSVSAERVFSTARDIVTAQRSTLASEHVDQLLFLHKNLHICTH